MDADQFKQFMLAFQTHHQQFLERVLPLYAPSTQQNSKVSNQRQLIRRCFSVLKISILKRYPSRNIANDLKTFLK
jgi:hypothetical protein